MGAGHGAGDAHHAIIVEADQQAAAFLGVGRLGRLEDQGEHCLGQVDQRFTQMLPMSEPSAALITTMRPEAPPERKRSVSGNGEDHRFPPITT